MPQHLLLKDDTRPVAAMPLFLKAHSWGEFVFDWAWADAWERAGRRYYPKLLAAVPLTPVSGPRLLCGDDPALAEALIQALLDRLDAGGYSSVHVNFIPTTEQRLLRRHDFLPRRDWQFHWSNRDYADFDGFLADLTHKKRKNIRQERRRVRRDGWRFRRVPGDQATAEDWARMALFYRHTFARKGNWALLSPEFFQALGESSLGSSSLLVLGERDGRPAAGALLLKGDTSLHGRYWGSLDPTPGLHFEVCYYQGIEYAIEASLSRFDPGVQGQHKLARGFAPVESHSAHFIADPALRRAVAEHLQWEADHHRLRGDELQRHLPFRREDTSS